MGLAGVVDPVDDAGQGGGFAAAGGARHQHHALPGVGQPHHRFRDAQLPIVRQHEADHPDHRAEAAPLAEGADPEPGQPRHRKGEVVVPFVQQPLHGPLSRQVVELLQQGLGIRRQQPVFSGMNDSSVAPEGGGQAADDEHIRRLPLHRVTQKFFQIDHRDVPLCGKFCGGELTIQESLRDKIQMCISA